MARLGQRPGVVAVLLESVPRLAPGAAERGEPGGSLFLRGAQQPQARIDTHEPDQKVPKYNDTTANNQQLTHPKTDRVVGAPLPIADLDRHGLCGLVQQLPGYRGHRGMFGHRDANDPRFVALGRIPFPPTPPPTHTQQS